MLINTPITILIFYAKARNVVTLILNLILLKSRLINLKKYYSGTKMIRY